MSQKEKFRLEVFQDLREGRMDRKRAASLMDLSLRQVDRLKKRYREEGLAALVHGNRGRRSNRAMPDLIRRQVMNIVREHYPDFGPTLAQEKLFERHGIKMSSEKLRQLMMAEGLWKGKKRRKFEVHKRRSRRARRGELLQGDASPHDWFEGRGARCTLVSFIDDATGQVAARFEPSETFAGYCRLFQEYINEHGSPRALYVDKSSIFRVNSGGKVGTGTTAFGEILKRLNVELIYAHSPQAKGRVERMYATFQDRVIKEMRLANVSTIEEANQFLLEYLPVYNARFSKKPALDEDVHQRVPCHLDLNEIFTRREVRKLSKSLDFSFEGVVYQVVGCKEPRRVGNQTITVCTPLEGKKWVECRGRRLEIEVYNELPVSLPMDRKQLDSWLDHKLPLTKKQRVRRKIACPC